jgi:NTP pyrophosphatase (non-canonical NTP hydrolase)
MAKISKRVLDRMIGFGSEVTDKVPSQSGCFQSIAHERTFQDKKWGRQDHPDQYWLAILMEEVGELAKCILDRSDKGHPDFLRNKELIQVAAVCVAWMECLARNGDGAKVWEQPDAAPIRGEENRK